MPEPIDIQRLQSIQPNTAVSGAQNIGPVSGPSFSEVLRETLDKVNDLQANADQSIQKVVTGESKNMADVMVAVENAGVAFQFTMQVRNKIVEAYQELMRMQI